MKNIGINVEDLIKEQDTDAMKWAQAFCNTCDQNQFGVEEIVDEGYMVGWFANAIMAMYDKINLENRERLTEKVAQAWCTPENSHKEMDVDLATAIVDLILSE